MRQYGSASPFAGGSVDTVANRMLLGRFGREFAALYGNPLDDRLPKRLQDLVDRLEGRTAAEPGRRDFPLRSAA